MAWTAAAVKPPTDRSMLKQPRQGVVGLDRSGSYLLSLDEQARQHREALIELADHLFTAICVGNQAPVVERMYNRITQPVVGDLVVETSRRGRRADDEARLMALGYLVEHRYEWWETDEEWNAHLADDGGLTDEDRTIDEAWYVQYGPNPDDVCRWTNANFRAVPVDMTFNALSHNRGADGSVMISRDDLIGSLVDSGHMLPTDAVSMTIDDTHSARDRP